MECSKIIIKAPKIINILHTKCIYKIKSNHLNNKQIYNSNLFNIKFSINLIKKTYLSYSI